ncbi:MAG TPA: hypothetical protein VFV08_13925, partial [Puia sp.]|nr:hypothetical protein [Puia sp.]
LFNHFIPVRARAFRTRMKPYGVAVAQTTFHDTNVIKVSIDTNIKTFDEPTFAKITDTNFHDGTIEVNVLSKFLPNAPDWARGFIGIAFRINNDNSKFECIYIRPDNGRVNDQIRRNHSTQYFSYPNHKFSDFRKSDPEKYESYADMGMNEWIRMKIVVRGSHAQLFINDSKQPCLIINDLKYGADISGAIGLWVGNWTEGYFSYLKISN